MHNRVCLESATALAEPSSRPALRNEYRLTRKGWDLWPVLMALTQWGETYTLGTEGLVLDIRHTDCDAPVHVVVECSAEHSTLSPREVTARLGTGARPRS